MIGKNALFVAVLATALGLAARYAAADTITVHDLTQNTVTGVYTYQVTMDNSAMVKTSDGFVISDFAGETSYSFSDEVYFGGNNPFSNFSMTSVLTGGDGLNDSAVVTALLSIDSPTITNLVFKYSGATYTNPSIPNTDVATATLTIDTSLHNESTGDAVGVDHSGAGHTYGISENTVMVPSIIEDHFVPPPATWLEAAGLMALFGVARLIKRHRADA